MVLVAIVMLLVLIGATLFIVLGAGNALGGIKWSEKVLQGNVERDEKILQEYYDDYKSNDGGFDAYETSIMLAKAVEFTWRDCYKICKNEKELFTGFFARNPINFNKDMDCGNYPVNGGGKIYPYINKIAGKCSTADLGTDKTDIIDEWTVTVWGLSQNSEICNDKEWGNKNCGSMDVSKDGKSCADLCDRAGDGLDKIDWKAGAVAKSMIEEYKNIRIIYAPGGWTSEPEIIVKEITASSFDFSLSLNPTSGSVAKGSSTTTTVTATLTSGTAQTVSFSCPGLPPDISCSFNPTSITPTSSGTSSTLTISTALTTPAMTYPITVTGTGGGSTATNVYNLIILT